MTLAITRRGLALGGASVLGAALAGCSKPAAGGKDAAAAGALSLLNVSYDPTRELYRAYNEWFAADWKQKNGKDVTTRQSHGGSGAQALSVIGGLEADVVTLALAYDIDSIVQRTQSIAPDWQTRLPDNACPYTSTIVFLVRKGNPKGVKDWGDLVKPGVQIITPNPKTSGGARWNYLAAYGWALRQPGGSPDTAKAYLQTLFKQVPVLDSGARGATNTFVQRGIGDVLLAWENEALLALAEIGPDKIEMVTPSFSILAEPPVAVVDKVADRHGTRALAEAYLTGLYSDKGQEIIAQNHYRPRNKAVLEKLGAQFKPLELTTIQQFGGWAKAHQDHFADGALFDQIYRPKP